MNQCWNIVNWTLRNCHQAIIWTNAGIHLLLIGPLGTNFSEILIEICIFSFMKMHLKMFSGKSWPFCLCLNEVKGALSFFVFVFYSFFLKSIVICRTCVIYAREDNSNVLVMITRLRWITSTLLSAAEKRPLKLITHSFVQTIPLPEQERLLGTILLCQDRLQGKKTTQDVNG